MDFVSNDLFFIHFQMDFDWLAEACAWIVQRDINTKPQSKWRRRRKVESEREILSKCISVRTYCRINQKYGMNINKNIENWTTKTVSFIYTLFLLKQIMEKSNFQ